MQTRVKFGYYFDMMVHFMTANSRHGTHSPFVYRLAEELIYKKQQIIKSGRSKSERLLKDIAAYYQVSYAVRKDEVGEKYALMVVEQIGLGDLIKLQKQYKYLVVSNIYKDVRQKNLWSRVCKDQRFIVCIDLFFFGLVFFRTEQPKQLFKLRFPFWKY